MKFAYPARLRPHSTGTLTASFRDLPECEASGSDEYEALAYADEALNNAIAARIINHDPIPVPSPCGTGEHLVTLPLQTAAKAALALALRKVEDGHEQLAMHLGIDEEELDRMLDPRHPIRTDRMQIAMWILGRDLVVESLPLPEPGEGIENSAALAARRARGLAGTVPIEVIRAKRAGAHPLLAWRTARGLTIQALAASSGVHTDDIRDIEMGRFAGAVHTLDPLAHALGCSVDDIAPDLSPEERIATLEGRYAALADGRGGRRKLTGAAYLEFIDALRAGTDPVRALRTARGLTVQALAADSGVSEEHISNIETGRELAHLDTLDHLAKALGCDAGDLIPF